LRGGSGDRVGRAVGVAEFVADHQPEPAHVSDRLVLVGDQLQRLLEL
jgi:hypothetical protein